ncbi:hypothetical protein QUA20_02875 [Microcoleus sp. Pol7_A1]|uniref:hypothetical protein n=1 Tax=Microcoleus sp. Pol7_A1 TaxID=2818893 RepID=UPI002FD2C84B
MNVWIITTGSSDIQLTTDKHWNCLCDRAKEQQDSNKKLHFGKNIELTKSVVKPKGSDRPITRFLAPARAMGIVYGNAITENVERYNDLDFSLLNNFSMLLNEKKIIFDRIIIFVTDQNELFTTTEKNQIYCPYWQDTCSFEDLVKQYFQRFSHKLEEIQPEFLVLKPDVKNPDSASNRQPGLDDWNSVLKIVQEKIAGIQDIPENATVYVSHQASTPAISSAIQFASLAKFGKQVEFLVSNVDDLEHPADIISSGEYLKGIKFEQAKELLRNHDYAGVKLLVNDYLDFETQILLDAAIQWNFAKFDDFAKMVLQHPDGNLVEKVNDRTKKENWWWTAYEEGYLAVVRLDQKNTVEAMFHSFRAVEGLIREWAVWKYQPQIRDSNPNQPRTLYFHDENINMSTQLRYWFDRFFNKNHSNVGLFGEPLFELLKASLSPGRWHNNSDIKTVAKITKEERNSIFHQLRGLREPELFAAWDTDNAEDWEKRVLSCLIFISEQDPDFDLSRELPLKEVSLISHVHKELKNAIAPNNFP